MVVFVGLHRHDHSNQTLFRSWSMAAIRLLAAGLVLGSSALPTVAAVSPAEPGGGAGVAALTESCRPAPFEALGREPMPSGSIAFELQVNEFPGHGGLAPPPREPVAQAPAPRQPPPPPPIVVAPRAPAPREPVSDVAFPPAAPAPREPPTIRMPAPPPREPVSDVALPPPPPEAPAPLEPPAVLAPAPREPPLPPLPK